MKSRFSISLPLGSWLAAGLAAVTLSGAEPDPAALLEKARAAEQRLDSRRALELYLEAEKLRPNDAHVVQKIARQYSDLIVDAASVDEKRTLARQALAYSERAVALAPRDPVSVLSVAISHGKLAVYSETREKVALSRLVREEAEKALALDPQYAWAHHILGRWHYEVANLGATARFFVRLFYGGLPTASTAEAVRYLQRAVELEPNELQHQLELGFAWLAHGQPKEARTWFERGLALPTRSKHDEPAKARARAALATLG